VVVLDLGEQFGLVEVIRALDPQLPRACSRRSSTFIRASSVSLTPGVSAVLLDMCLPLSLLAVGVSRRRDDERRRRGFRADRGDCPACDVWRPLLGENPEHSPSPPRCRTGLSMSVNIRVIGRALRPAARAGDTGGPRPLPSVVVDVHPVGLA
jgi:hypothetical protein